MTDFPKKPDGWIDEINNHYEEITAEKSTKPSFSGPSTFMGSAPNVDPTIFSDAFAFSPDPLRDKDGNIIRHVDPK